MAEKDLHHKLTADASSLESGMRRGSRAMSDAEREARRLERQQQKTHAAMDQLGRGMLVAGAAIAAGLALSVKAAIEWESAWAGVLKTVDGTPEQMAALEEEIRSLTAVLPASHTEIAAVAEAAGQLGVQRENVAAFTRVMIDMGEATNLSATDAATALARFMNIMQTAPDQVDRLGSAIVDLGNSSATTEAEIVEMSLRIAGAGQAIGLTEAEVLAFSASLSSVGVAAEAGGTAISRAFLTIDKAVRGGGEELEAFAEVAGMSASQFAQAYRTEPAAAIDSFVQGLGRIQQSGGDVTATLEQLGLSEIRVSDALRRLSGAGDLLTRSLQTGSDAWDENIALTEEAERRYGTTEARMGIARNQVNDFAISIGQTLLPALGSMSDTLADVAGLLADLPGPARTVLAVLAAVAATVLLLGGGLLLIVPRIAATKAALDQLALSAGRAGVAARLLNTGVGAVGRFLTGPWGIAIGVAITALTAFGISQAEARGKVQEVSETLDQQTAAITDNTKAWVAHTLEEEGALAAAEQLGIDLSTLTAAILGEADAIDRVNGVLAEHDQQMGDVHFAVQEYRRELEAQGVAQEELAARTREYEAELNRQDKAANTVRDTMGGLGDTVEEAQESTRRQAEATEASRVAMDDLDPAARRAAESLGITAGQAEELTDQIDELDKRIKALLDSTFGLTQAEDALTESMRELVEQVEAQVEAGDRGAGSLDGNTAAAIDNRRAMEDLIEKYAAMIVEMTEAGASSDDVAAKTDAFRQELLEVAEQLGIDQDELDIYLALLDDIPSLVSTEVSIDTAAAQRRIDNLRGSISQMMNALASGSAQAPAGGIAVPRQHGGFIPGPSWPPDQVPVAATGGEFMVRRSVAQQHAAALEALNTTGRMPVRAVAVAGGDGTSGVGGMLEGELYLDSGEFLGVVRGEVRRTQSDHDRQLRRRVGAGAGAAR